MSIENKTKTEKTKNVPIREPLHLQLVLVAKARKKSVQALQEEIDAEWLKAHPVHVEVAKATNGGAS